MRGVISAAGYVPFRRLRRASVSEFLGTGGGKGSRTVASHDEDTTTMGLEAARLALAAVPAAAPDALWFSTPTPAYLDKTNANAIHAALRLPVEVSTLDFGGALRSGVGALRAAINAGGSTLVIVADQRDGLPGGPDESFGGDSAAALLVGDDSPGAPVIAELIGSASASDEFIDRGRTPGERRSKMWEERFGETRYLPLGRDAWDRALKLAGAEASQVSRVVVTSMHGRAAKALSSKLGTAKDALCDDMSATVGQSGAAHPVLVLSAALETAQPGDVIALVHLADGADVLVFRVTDAIGSWTPTKT